MKTLKGPLMLFVLRSLYRKYTFNFGYENFTFTHIPGDTQQFEY